MKTTNISLSEVIQQVFHLSEGRMFIPVIVPNNFDRREVDLEFYYLIKNNENSLRKKELSDTSFFISNDSGSKEITFRFYKISELFPTNVSLKEISTYICHPDVEEEFISKLEFENK